ncbi:protein ALTERED PHOSPHATE STARVATION RESPONSE 1 [Manihot esculenta]|uniref:DUF632 domain-containing protein n=2 Tax=Manihot esculenta TaxID=3983 RepID=A0A2C9VVX2_MANES|nr:protein ALTERED PHOSPHATE STARVATION RESPONSE 1 [Manihot esculenta]KAG8654512.1 hypothetical protein MANES_05G135300v8 [Manihot esculenta]OAY50431.1 hypothetical protein MANES_05G135300v8 [Manihot esculenta]
MGCSTSRIDHLPVVSLCHDRCKFLDEALYQSYALADAHLAYMHSLKSLGPSLRRFFDQNLDNSLSDCNSNGDSAAAKHNPLKSSPSPHHCPSSSNSESHLDFSSDSEDDEFKDGDVDPLHRIHTNYFERQTSTPSKSDLYAYHEPNKYDYFANNGGLFRSRASPYGASSPDGGSAWKTPSPPPPSGSTWEFLNFFDTYERYELPVKDKEGIHELKDELENKIHGDSVNLAGEKKQSKVKLTVENGDAKQPEVDVVQMNVISEKEKQASAESKNQSTPDIMSELENLFEKAAESGNPVLKILDTGKVRYYHKNSIYQGVSSKMLHVVNPLVIPSKNTEPTSTEKIGSVRVGSDEDLAVISVNLSSTLKKLCMWEKKLYDEVKAEEKLRIMLARTYRQIKNIGEKDAEANKVDSARNLIRALSTKIKVAIQVIDRTSIAINKLRDEELWPLISELIQKLLEMWKAMLECHRRQNQAVVEARGLDAIVSNGKFSEIHLEAAIQLKIELQNCNLSFSNWITAQKSYIKALNGWLLKFLPREPQEMPDETEPLSPGKAGVPLPPVFAFFNQWSHAIGIISEMEVINTMYGLFMSINQLVERHYIYLQQRLIADKDLERRIKILEREEKRMQKLMQARVKKTFLASKDVNGTPFPGGAVHQSEVTHNSSLQSNLKQLFMAIEKFSSNSVQAYEELHVLVEEGRNPEGP